jgi:hypothetical protein
LEDNVTARRRDGQAASPFLEWIRRVPELDSREFCISVQDNDVWIHQYSSRNEAPRGMSGPIFDNLMLVEVKTFYADVPYAQRDTLDVVNGLLRKASVVKGRRRLVRLADTRHAGCFRRVRCFGVHFLQLSGDRPDNSDEILWDQRHQLSIDGLVNLLRYEHDPDHPMRKLDTRRHHLRPLREIHPSLQLAISAE